MKKEIDQNAGYQTGPRIKKFLEYKGEKIAVFTKKTGIDRSLITRSFNQIRDFGVTSLQKIGLSYPELSLNWVITGQGEMLLPDLNEVKYFMNHYNSIEENEDKNWFLIKKQNIFGNNWKTVGFQFLIFLGWDGPCNVCATCLRHPA